MSLDKFKQAALTGARWTLAARIGLQLVTWPATILVVRLLEPGDYGLFAIAMLVTGFVTLFAELGLGVALVQAHEVNEETARVASTVILLLNGLVGLTIIVLAPWVADAFHEPDVALVMQVLTIELLLGAFAAVPQAMLERQLQFRQLSLAQMVAGVAGVATTVTAALLDGGVWSLVAGSLVIALVRSVLLIWFHGRLVWPGPLRWSTIRPMVHVSSHVVASRALWYWYGQSDQLVVGRVLHASMLGLYNVAAQLAMLPASKAMEAVNRVAFPILSRIRSDTAALQHTHQRMIGLLALYAFGICWGLGAVAHEFVFLVLGAKWALAATPLTMLSLIAPLRMLCAMHNTVATAVGVPQAATKELALAGLVMPVAFLAGAWWDGLAGASLAWLVAFPAVYLVSNHLTTRALGMRALAGLRPLAAPLAAGLGLLASVWLVRSLTADRVPLALQLAAEIAAGALAYSGLLWLFARPLLLDAQNLLLDLLRPRRTAS